jgi:hypothetical protein
MNHLTNELFNHLTQFNHLNNELRKINLFMQNKPNFIPFLRRKLRFRQKTNPIQTQSNPKTNPFLPPKTAPKPKTNPIKPNSKRGAIVVQAPGDFRQNLLRLCLCWQAERQTAEQYSRRPGNGVLCQFFGHLA